jgi:hypothetical protein
VKLFLDRWGTGLFISSLAFSFKVEFLIFSKSHFGVICLDSLSLGFIPYVATFGVLDLSLAGISFKTTGEILGEILGWLYSLEMKF